MEAGRQSYHDRIEIGTNVGENWFEQSVQQQSFLPQGFAATTSPPTLIRDAHSWGAFTPAQGFSSRYQQVVGPTLASEGPQESFVAISPPLYAGREQTFVPIISHDDNLRDEALSPAGQTYTTVDPWRGRWPRPLSSSTFDRPSFLPWQDRQRSSSAPGTVAYSAFYRGQSGRISAPPLVGSPSKDRPDSAASMESTDSCESRSSIGSLPHVSSAKVSGGSTVLVGVGQKKKSRKPASSPASPAIKDSSEEKSAKSPLPQNLRGDPFRSAKVKTELCRHYNTEKGCPFGDKCNYAHGEHELKYTKLMDLERAGLADIEIFRTHPCPSWVATGACPFDQRCIGLHDPRVAGSHPSWLPHAETLINSIGSGVNVDKLYHQRLASVYSCSPLCGYIPPKRWKADPDSAFFAWKHFYAFVCNIDVKELSRSSYEHYIGTSHVGESSDTEGTQSGSNEKYAQQTSLPHLHQIAIALKMRERKLGQCYAYLPSHLFRGELCMVLQKRIFNVNYGEKVEGGISEMTSGEISSTERNQNDIIVAHEVAFGPVGDPSVRQVSVWFNISRGAIVPCTPQQAKRHKRSRHRLRKKGSQREKSKTSPPATAPVKASRTSAPPQDKSETLPFTPIPVFYNYQPLDNDTFDLITGILMHRIRVLELQSPHPAKKISYDFIRSLASEEQKLQRCFESQRRHWMTWSWPVNLGRGEVDDATDVPPVNGTYRFLADDDNFNTEAFHGRDDGNGIPILSSLTKMTTGFIWKSFIINMQLISGRRTAHHVKDEQMPSHEVFQNVRRLPVFRTLSLSKGITEGNRILPHISTTATRSLSLGNKHRDTTQLSSLFDDWDDVKTHYEKNQNSPLRVSQATQDPSSSSAAFSTAQSREEFEEDFTKLLDDGAHMWTRVNL